jgi:hypothetical protein
MLTIFNFPNWMKGELYATTMEIMENMDEAPVIEKKLKTDLHINNIIDIFDLIDTCGYVGVELPFEVLDYAFNNYEKVSDEIYTITNIENNPYDYYMTTNEYIAIYLCVNYMTEIIDDECAFRDFMPTSYYYYYKKFVDYAIMNHSLLLVRFLDWKLKLHRCHLSILITTAQYGEIEIMKYWRQKEWFNKTVEDQQNQGELCVYAVSHGQIEMLKYLRETCKFEWDNRSFESALHAHDIKCIRYLISNKFPVSSTIMRRAIRCRYDVECIRILVEEVGVSINDPNHTLFAIETEDMEILHYLHEKNAPWHVNCVNTALQMGLVEIAKFCILNGAPYDVNYIELYNSIPSKIVEWNEWISKFIGNK